MTRASSSSNPQERRLPPPRCVSSTPRSALRNSTSRCAAGIRSSARASSASPLMLSTLRRGLGHRPDFRIDPVVRSFLDRCTVGRFVPCKSHAQRIEQIAFESAQGPRQGLASRQLFANARVQVENRLGCVIARRQLEQQFVDVEGRHQRVAGQLRRHVERLGLDQPSQFAARQVVDADELQWLQRCAQGVSLGRGEASGNQADATVFAGQQFDDDTGLAPWPDMQNKSRLPFDAHGRASAHGRQDAGVGRRAWTR